MTTKPQGETPLTDTWRKQIARDYSIEGVLDEVADMERALSECQRKLEDVRHRLFLKEYEQEPTPLALSRRRRMGDINSFSGTHRWLSNFWPCLGSSVEHHYQAAKCLNNADKRAVLAASTPGKAKQLGRRFQMRADWEEVKEGVMLNLLRRKFADGSLQDKLIETGESKLVEGNHWNDTYWGVCNGKGKNRLGELLMQVRCECVAKLKQEKS